MTGKPADTPPENIRDITGEISFWQPSVLIPFMTVSLIWGGTWIVIRDQLSVVPPSWSVTYRFILAAVAMFALARLRGLPLGMSREGQIWALLLGLFQFSFNFNFVYRAEIHVTSGLVAVMFALLIIPNALFGAIFLKQRITPLFVIGSLLAMAGVAALFAHEFEVADRSFDTLWLGIGFTMLGVLSASVANIMQGTETLKRWPIITMLAWAMLWGAVINAGYALVTVGAPVAETRWSYWAGIAYLALAASVVTFPLYFGLIRRIGPGRAAYSSTIVPVIAMLLSTLFEGYQWTALAILGGVLALAGLVIAMQARRSR
ncbi:MAG: DMT family transporter [Pseudomonadota bacterium]